MKVRITWDSFDEAAACEFGKTMFMLMPYIEYVIGADNEGVLLRLRSYVPLQLEEWLEYTKELVKPRRIEIEVEE